MNFVHRYRVYRYRCLSERRKLGGKGQNSMSWMIVSPRPELINKLVRQTHEWHLLEGLVRYWYTFLRK